MTLDEALTEAVNGARMTAPHMQTGCYIEHTFARGFLRCWPVDRIEDEPNRTQCEFRADDDDRAADWIEVERPALAVDHSPRDAWGKATPAAIVAEANATAEAFAALIAKPKAPAPGVWGAPTMKIDGEVVGEIKSFAIEPVPARDVWGVPKV